MIPHPEPLLPDDEHYYFGVELPYSPEEVQQRLLRKPEFLYSITSDDDEMDEEYRTSWLYLWRCNEGWEMRIGNLPAREQIAQMHARHNMGLHVVLHALTEDEALNPSTYSDRQPIRYILVEPSSAEGCQTIPRLNLLRATGNTEATRFHVIKSAIFAEFYKDEKMESYVPEEVSQEMQAIKKEIWQLENALLLQPWYAGCHHQRYTHPSGLVLCATYPPLGEYRRELLDFYPGRQLCYK